MNFEFCEGVYIDLDTMTLHLDLTRFKPSKRTKALAFDLMPALEDAYCKYVMPDPPEEPPDEERNGDGWQPRPK
jgi:hypothetical protein